ncbi:hypothetical protein [Gluconacetobacter sacchari]|uniref:hypothetical protein n=1 Tax=Gluconacetobacter sacchari TaxID=92759 RepID=UPI001FE2CE82|nr:hypothetical protein [Gluconacetobacter sacchari]
MDGSFGPLFAPGPIVILSRHISRVTGIAAAVPVAPTSVAGRTLIAAFLPPKYAFVTV